MLYLDGFWHFVNAHMIKSARKEIIVKKYICYSSYLEYLTKNMGRGKQLDSINLEFEGILSEHKDERISDYSWFIHEILNDKNMKERRWFKFVAEYLFAPVGKVEHYLMRKKMETEKTLLAYNLREIKKDDGIIFWNIYTADESDIVEMCEDETKFHNSFFFGSYLDNNEVYDFFQSLFTTITIENWKEFEEKLCEIKYYLCMNSNVFFDYIDLGDEEQLSLCFGKGLSKEMLELYEKIKF